MPQPCRRMHQRRAGSSSTQMQVGGGQLGKDYEYASFNTVTFVIGNHLCEMAADYHTARPHVLDFTKCPDEVRVHQDHHGEAKQSVVSGCGRGICNHLSYYRGSFVSM